MTTITVQRPITVREPRAAALAAQLFSQFLGWFERSGAARAERRERADRATEAAAVRQYATHYASHDPRFAAELLSAADRHELTGAVAQAVTPELAATQAARNLTDPLRTSRTS